jgi:hypothetical protein
MIDQNLPLIEQLARGNAADVSTLRALEKLLAQLQQAGLYERRHEYSLDPPLGRLNNVTGPGPWQTTTR